MDKTALELYLYMGSTKPIIEWLEQKGVKTKKEAIDTITPLILSNMIDVKSHIDRGEYNVSLYGTSQSVEKIIKHFER